MLSVFTDGGARGNPGPAAIGVYITDGRADVFSLGEKIGISTNNVAEYKAILKAISWLSAQKELINVHEEICFYMDSELAYSQLVGIYKIKNAALREILFSIREKEAEIKAKIRYFHIPREKNKQADRLVNLALDNNL